MTVDDEIRNILADDIFVETPVAEMSGDDSLRDAFGLDSIGFVELRVQCESRFGVRIGEADFTPENFATIDSVTAMVERLRSAVPAG